MFCIYLDFNDGNMESIHLSKLIDYTFNMKYVTYTSLKLDFHMEVPLFLRGKVLESVMRNFLKMLAIFPLYKTSFVLSTVRNS